MTGVPSTTRNAYNRALTSADGGPSLAVYMLQDHNENLENIDNNTALCKWNATVAPTINDDSGDGYAAGSQWLIASTGYLYECLDATVGAAVWAIVYPSAALDFSQVLPEMGDIPYWNGTAISPLHHGTKGHAILSGGHAAAPYISDFPFTGWVEISDVLTYQGAANPVFQVTCPGDRTSTYTTGQRIKLTQGGLVRYFVVMRSYYTSPSTYIILDGGARQELASSIITLPYISNAYLPGGFPIQIVEEGWTGINEAVAYTSWTAAILSGTITATSADLSDRIRPGSRVRWWQAGSVRYGIVTIVSYAGGNTVLTIYGGNDYVIAASAITGFSFSNQRFPYGFPSDEKKWEFAFYNETDRITASPPQYSVYNPGGETWLLPAGVWKFRIDYMDFELYGTLGSVSAYMWLDEKANGSGQNYCGSEIAVMLDYVYGMIWGQSGVVANFDTAVSVYLCMMTRHAGGSSMTSWSRYFTLECMYF